eukprot:4253065-Pyramimonas_sp.AAC.1
MGHCYACLADQDWPAVLALAHHFDGVDGRAAACAHVAGWGGTEINAPPHAALLAGARQSSAFERGADGR